MLLIKKIAWVFVSLLIVVTALSVIIIVVLLFIKFPLVFSIIGILILVGLMTYAIYGVLYGNYMT